MFKSFSLDYSLRLLVILIKNNINAFNIKKIKVKLIIYCKILNIGF